MCIHIYIYTYVNIDCQALGQRVKVMVTQPRRIAAITLARRVADQRGVELGTQVGYRIGQGDHVDSKDSVITFVTVGYMLQYLSHNPTAMQRYTHVVLDEVHERSMDMDLLNLLIKKLMALQQDSKTRLVVMSATLQAGLFGEYFTPKDQTVAPSIFVGARRFPVQSIYLEQLLQTLPSLRNTCGSAVSKAVNAFESAARVHSQGKGVAHAMGGSLVKPEVSPELRKVICEAVWKMCQPDSCILIFLPGIGEIGALQDDLDGKNTPVPLQVCSGSVLQSVVWCCSLFTNVA